MNSILVTGAAKGLGAEICRTLIAQGHSVIIHYRSSHREAEQLLDECRLRGIAFLIQGDLSTHEHQKDFIRRYTEQFPQTQGVVNNVGTYLVRSLIDTEYAQWMDLFQTNFFASVLINQALISQLRECKGSIVNIGVSGLLAQRAFTQSAAYAAAKSALYFYTRSLAKELAAESVRVNMVSPGCLENSVDLDPTTLPMHRAVTLKEVALVVASLFDPNSASITGQNIEVAGALGL